MRTKDVAVQGDVKMSGFDALNDAVKRFGETMSELVKSITTTTTPALESLESGFNQLGSAGVTTDEALESIMAINNALPAWSTEGYFVDAAPNKLAATASKVDPAHGADTSTVVYWSPNTDLQWQTGFTDMQGQTGFVVPTIKVGISSYGTSPVQAKTMNKTRTKREKKPKPLEVVEHGSARGIRFSGEF